MSLVAPPRCTYPVPCNVCWYCHVATDGPEWCFKTKAEAQQFLNWLHDIETAYKAATKRARKR